MHPHSKHLVLAIAATLAVGLYVVVEAVDVRVGHSKTFDFKSVRSWAWNPKGSGDVVMARTQQDDAKAMKESAEPVIVSAVAAEMPKRGLQQAAEPDVTLTYYLLLSINASAQTVGQFLPATTAWGLPPFPEATQSLSVMNQGSLVLDFSAKGDVVWRGVAQATIKPDAPAAKREALLRDAIREVLKRFPPKP